MDAKLFYTLACKNEPTIPIFSQAWWLDATAEPQGWDVAVVHDGVRLLASMPYVTRRRYGFRISTQPQLTQSLGPWLRASEAKSAKRLARDKDLMAELIDGLPPSDYFVQNWHHTQTNWLPFYWRGFRQTTRYTYVLNDLSDMDAVWRGFDQGIRTDIRKARDRFGLVVRDDLGLDAFLALNRMVFARQGKRVPYGDDFVRRIDAACASRGTRMILIAQDGQGRHHAGVYVVWDTESAYYLMGGGDPELRNSGATSLCMWEAIQRASANTRSFDFEGSMIEPVERFFRSFGAQQTPYFELRKIDSRLLRAVHQLRN
jgi:hypothetical protein